MLLVAKYPINGKLRHCALSIITLISITSVFLDKAITGNFANIYRHIEEIIKKDKGDAEAKKIISAGDVQLKRAIEEMNKKISGTGKRK